MNDADRLADWFGRFITRYRNAGEVMPPAALPARIEVEWLIAHGHRLLRHPWSRMAWRRAGRAARLYVGGMDLAMPVRDARRIAAAADVEGDLYAALSQAGRDAVFELLSGGHYRLAPDDEE
jgi:50S ribosomal protein L16 3-hydroxylase